jgi:hypothetical protein
MVGVDYWIKPLKNYRVELYPEVTYSKSNTISSLGDFDARWLDFNLNTNFYLLNFESDCNCPTFSKQESFIEKGFFIQFAPGVSYFTGKFESEDQLIDATDLAFKIGLGIGLDIGVSDLVTVTPILKYNRYFKMEFEGISQIDPLNSSGTETTDINRFFAGIHIGIRWKE